MKKVIALGLCVVFISQQVLFAQKDFSARQTASPEFSVAPSHSENQIPAEIGTVIDRFGKNPAVILIQDAHGHNEAQTNTVRILEWLDTFEKTEALFIEGGFGDLKAARLRFSGNGSEDLAFARTLMDQSDIGGAEYFLLQQLTGRQKRVPAYGLENPALYFENLKAYQATMAAEIGAKKKLEAEWTELQHQVSRRLNPELSAFYKSWLGYAKSEDFSRAFPVLNDAARKHLNLSFQDARSQIEWPMLTRLAELKKRGKKIDHGKAQDDKQRLVRWLEQLKGNDSSYLEILKQEKFLDIPRFDGQLFGFASRREFWEKFYLDMGPRGFDFEKYPHLTLWEGARILESELEADVLQKEMNRLEALIFERLTKTPEEKNLVQKAEQLLLVEKLVALKLTRPEFEAVVQKHELRKDALFRNAFNFYRRALLRDRVMAENLERTMRRNKIQKAAVIVGGFHTGGLTSRFKQKNISYAVIRPHLSEIGSGQDYRDVVMGKFPAMPFNPSTLRAFSWLNAPRYFSRLPNANRRRYNVIRKSFPGKRSEVRGNSEAQETYREVQSTVQNFRENFPLLDQALEHIDQEAEWLTHHFERVSQISIEFGARLWKDKDPEERKKLLRELGVAAYLHDIGKSLWDSRFINNSMSFPSPAEMEKKTSPEEVDRWKQWRKWIEAHPQDGRDFLDQLGNYLFESHGLSKDAVLKGILDHHENEDGTGYPSKLKSPEISVYGKLIHLVDSFDAAKARRFYSAPMSTTEVFDFLQKKSGFFYNKEYVELFTGASFRRFLERFYQPSGEWEFEYDSGVFVGSLKGEEIAEPRSLLQNLSQQFPGENKKNMVVVDIGSYKGSTSEWILNQGFSVLGIDLAPGHAFASYLSSWRKKNNILDSNLNLAQSAALMAKAENPTIAYGIQDVTKGIPLPDASVHGVVLHRIMSTLLNETQIRRLMKEIKRVLKPGGQISILDYYRRDDAADPEYQTYQTRYANHEKAIRILEEYGYLKEGPEGLHEMLSDPELSPLLVTRTKEGSKSNDIELNGQELADAIIQGKVQIQFIVFHASENKFLQYVREAGLMVVASEKAGISYAPGKEAKLIKLIVRKEENVSRSELRVTMDRLREIDRTRKKITAGMLEDVLEGLASRSPQVRQYADEVTDRMYRSNPRIFSKKNLLFAMDILQTDPDAEVIKLVLTKLSYFAHEIDAPKLEKILQLKTERKGMVSFLSRLLKGRPVLARDSVYDYIVQTASPLESDEINLLGQLIRIKPEYGHEHSLRIILNYFGGSANLQGLKPAIEWFEKSPKAFTVGNYQLFRKSFPSLSGEALPVYYRFAKANTDEVLKDESMIPYFILPLLWDDRNEDNQRMAAEILMLFLEKNPHLKKYAGPRVKKILARYKSDIQMTRLIDTVNGGGKTGLDTNSARFTSEGGFRNKKPRPRSEARTVKPLSSATILGKVDESLPARLFLNVLRIKQAEWIKKENGPEEGSMIIRIRIPEPRPEKILPRGLEILEHELAPTREFELLFNKKGNLIAIFPLLKPALKNKRVLNYFDISHLYFSPPAITPTSDANTSIHLWDEFWSGFEADERLLEKYKESRDIHTFASAQKKNEDLYHVSRTDWDAGGFYSLAMNLKTGKVFIRPLWKNDFQKRQKSLKSILKYEEGMAKTIIPRFPTVYYPKLGNDRDYANGIFDYVKSLNLSPGDPLFVGGVGSGSDSWFLFQALKALGKEGIDVYGFDVNAVALANAAATVRGSGFNYKALKLHDNLIARNGKPAFPGIIFKGGIWNTPEEEGEIDPEFERVLSSQRRMAEWWDGHPVLRRLARGLRTRLAPDTPTHLWAKRVGYGFGGVKNIMAKGGLQVTQVGNYAYRILKTSALPEKSTRSEVRQSDNSVEDESQQHHFRVESMIEFYPKDFLLFAENPVKRGTPNPMISRYYSRPAETGPPNIFVPGQNPQHDRRVLLVRKAIEWMKKRSKELNDPAIDERAQRIGRETTVISVSAPTRLFVYNARDARIGVYHISRRRSAIHFPVLYLDSLDPADENHVEELALYLDRAQRWIDAYEAAEKNVRQNKIKLEDVPEIMELDRARFEEQDQRMLGDDKKFGLILERLKALADIDRHNEPERVTEIRIFHETVSEIERNLERKKNPTRDDFYELATYYGRLAHLQENAGSHVTAILSYRKQVKALHQLQVYDTGQLPLKIQKDIIRILLRAGLDGEFLNELKVFFTGYGFIQRENNPMGLWRHERGLLKDEIEYFDTAYATELISVLWEKKSLIRGNYQNAKLLETEVLKLYKKALLDITSEQWELDSLNFPAYPQEEPRSEVRNIPNATVLSVAEKMTAKIVARGMEWMAPPLFAAEDVNPELETKETVILAELLKGNASAILPAGLMLGARASIRERFIELLALAVNGPEKQKIIFSGSQAPELLEIFSAEDIFKRTPRLHQIIQTNAADENILAARMKNETVSASFEDLDETSNLSLIPAFKISSSEFERLNPADQFHYLIHLTQLQLLAAEVLKDQLNDRATFRAQVLREFLTKAGIQFSEENGFLKPSAQSLVTADLTKLVQTYQLTSKAA